MNPLIRAYQARIDDVNATERSVVAKISTQDVDRYNTVFLSRGCDIRAYDKNRVVLWCHGKDPQRGERPIGKNQWIRVDRGSEPKIIAKTIFNDDEFSQQLFRDYQNGFLNAWSISALPVDFGSPTQEELRSYPSWEKVDKVYRKYEILEYSACGVPGNSSCTTINESEVRDLCEMVTRGYYIFPEVRLIVDQAKEAERMTESGGMADGGALVDGDDDEGDEDDDAPKKKKKKKADDAEGRDADDSGDEDDVQRSQVELMHEFVAVSKEQLETLKEFAAESRSTDDDDGDEAVPEAVERGADEIEATPETTDEPEAEAESETVERSAEEAEPVVDEYEKMAALFRRMVQEGRISIDDLRPAAKDEPTPEPEPEPEPVDPLAGLPPLAGRSFNEVLLRNLARIDAWKASTESMIRDFDRWFRGEG